jgi:hypothetical protein
MPSVSVPVRDFTGEKRAMVLPGAAVVRHAASRSELGWLDLTMLVRGEVPITQGRRVWLEGWVESPRIQELAHYAGLELVATKIKASSELVGVWAPPGTPRLQPIAPADVPTLVRLPRAPAPELVQAAAASLEGRLPAWADHYSGYNVRHSWSALALRGYREPGAHPELSPDAIEKPAEMSKAWKAEHPGWEDWPLAWSTLARIPELHELIAEVATILDTTFQRVRLMRLLPGGGELTRHSDITDPDAGTTSYAQVCRIHVPLITNPEVRFRQWRLDGRQVEAHMAAGEAWYLDTRKPHRAGNYGSTERVHLVMDVHASSAVREAIVAGAEAPEVAA